MYILTVEFTEGKTVIHIVRKTKKACHSVRKGYQKWTRIPLPWVMLDETGQCAASPDAYYSIETRAPEQYRVRYNVNF